MNRENQVKNALWNLKTFGFTNYQNELFERQITFKSVIYLQMIDIRKWECFSYNIYQKNIAKTYCKGDFIKCVNKAIDVVKFCENKFK